MGHKRTLAITTVTLGLLVAGCEDADIDTDATQDTVEEAGEQARETAQEAFASLRTDAERLVDEIQTNNAPQAKEDLLERCRDVLERLREAESEAADRVGDICDRIRDTDVEDAEVWDDIRQEINEVEVN